MLFRAGRAGHAVNQADPDDHRQQTGDAHQLDESGDIAGLRRDRETRTQHLRHIMDGGAEQDAGCGFRQANGFRQ